MLKLIDTSDNNEVVMEGNFNDIFNYVVQIEKVYCANRNIESNYLDKDGWYIDLEGNLEYMLNDNLFIIIDSRIGEEINYTYPIESLIEMY